MSEKKSIALVEMLQDSIEDWGSYYDKVGAL